MPELFAPFRHRLVRSMGKRRRQCPCRLALSAVGTQQLEVAASHQGAPFLHQANRGAAERVRAPLRTIGNMVAEDGTGDVAIVGAGKITVQRAQNEFQSPPSLGGETHWLDWATASQSAPQPAGGGNTLFDCAGRTFRRLARARPPSRPRARAPAKPVRGLASPMTEWDSLGAYPKALGWKPAMA